MTAAGAARPALPTAVLGRTGLEVTRLGFGSAHRPLMTEPRADELYNLVLDSGINFFDTAHDYKNSEQLIGAVLPDRYDEFHLATKCGCVESDGVLNSSDHVWTRDNLFRGIEVSLARMKRDSVDLVQLHNPTVEECESGGLVDALQDMRAQGLVRWIGMSSTLPHLPTFVEWAVFDAFQIPYSALERQHEEWLTRAAEAGAGIIVRGGVAQGEPGQGGGSDSRWASFEEAKLDELLEPGESRSGFVLRFTLAHPDAHTIIVGTSNLDHLRENVETVHEGPLPADVYAEAKRRLDAAGERPASS